MHHRLLVAALATASGLAAQSNAVPGLDGYLYDISSPNVWGRRGPAYPGGEIGFSAANYMCNPGTVTIPWYAAMAENHPKFGFMLARVLDGRIEQISDRSMCKHAFTSINGNQGPCAPCQNPGTGSLMGIGCYDVYSAGNNGSRTWLGPADEIDPWLGTWNHVGSYFDRGDPDVGPPGNMDGVRSPIQATDAVMNRITVQEQDLVTPGAEYFYMIHLLHEGEPVGSRSNNIMHRGITFQWSGSSWSAADSGPAINGSVLYAWPGASVSLGGNGVDDGRMAVGVLVTGPVGGMWHYEYAVHNIDNSRGGAALRVPLCPSATATNFSFRDIDGNALNQWTASVVNDEVVFTAPLDNALNWNSIYNFAFDCDIGPGDGAVTIDQARIGPGALAFPVSSRVPGGVRTSVGNNTTIGVGCGQPAPTLLANEPFVPNPNFRFVVLGAPNRATILAYSFGSTVLPLGPGCEQYLAPASVGTFGFYLSDASGLALIGLPLPATLQPFALHWQAAQLQPGGPALGGFAVSNGLRTEMTFVGGCQ